MEQFKIDVAECTEDEKRRIKERLVELGYGDNLVFHTWKKAGIIYCNVDGYLQWDRPGDETNMDWEKRPASDFLTKFQTRPHDFTGCDPDIAAALKRGEEILCGDSDGDQEWVWAWDNNMSEYRTVDVDGYYLLDDAKPVPVEPEKKTVTLELTDEQLAQIKEILK